MTRVIVVKQLRQYITGETRYTEIECPTLDLAAKIRYPYFVPKPKQGAPYYVLGKCPVFIRNVQQITHPLDDYPPGA